MHQAFLTHANVVFAAVTPDVVRHLKPLEKQALIKPLDDA